MVIEKLDRSAIRELLLVMFRGWEIHHKSWDENEPMDWDGGQYTKAIEDCMVEAADGDENLGFLIMLFSYWANDVISVAAKYGIGYRTNEQGESVIVDDIPPSPSEKHFWDHEKGEWVFYDEDGDQDAEAA